MNNKQKIIISVTGIFLVLLILVGLTYGYFLTKITGNNNSKSISVSTANLALVYGDGNGDVTATNIIPGNELTTKTFTVKNTGNDTTNYIVVIDNATSTFTNNDFVYTLTCTSDGEPCIGVSTETKFPITGGTLVSNTIEVGKTHTYSLTVTYTAWSKRAKSKLKTTTACIGDVTTKYDDNGAITTNSSYNYDVYIRLYGKGQTANATLICNAKGAKTSETQIFPLTADEVAFAGGATNTSSNLNYNYTYYLRDNATTGYWQTLSPFYFDASYGSVFTFGVDGQDKIMNKD